MARSTAANFPPHEHPEPQAAEGRQAHRHARRFRNGGGGVAGGEGSERAGRGGFVARRGRGAVRRRPEGDKGGGGRGN